MRDLHIVPPLTLDSYSSSSSSTNNHNTTMFASELAFTDFKRNATASRGGDLHDPGRQTKQQRRLSPTSSLHPTMAPRPRWEFSDEYALANDDDEQGVVSYANYWEDRWGQQTRSKSQRPNSFSSYNYPTTSATTASSSQQRHSYNNYGYSYSPDSDHTVLSESEDHEYDEDQPHCKKARRVSRIFSRAVRRQRHVSDPAIGTTASTAIEPTTSSSMSPYSAPPAITINNDPFLDAYPQNHPLTPSRSARSRASRRSQDGAYSLPSSPMHRPSSLLEEDEDDSQHRRSRRVEDVEEEEEEEEEAKVEYTPTCTEAIRKQWQAIALRIQFGVFRAQKRFKGRSARVKTRLGLTSQTS